MKLGGDCLQMSPSINYTLGSTSVRTAKFGNSPPPRFTAEIQRKKETKKHHKKQDKHKENCLFMLLVYIGCILGSTNKYG